MSKHRKTSAPVAAGIAEANQSLSEEINQFNKKNAESQRILMAPVNEALIKHHLRCLHNLTEQDIEIRICPNSRNSGGYPKSCFSRDISKILNFIKNNHTCDNGVYVGVATRTPGIQSGKAKHCEELPALWLDLDTDKAGLEKQECIQIMESCKHPPALIIDSGGGLHAYWLLTEVYDLKNNLHSEVKNILKRLAFIFNGDPAVCDVARIMRVAGTCNTKLAEARPVTIAKTFFEEVTCND